MKKNLLACAALLVFGASCAQRLKQSEIPVNVKTTFGSSFPNAKNVEWSKEGENEFEAEFKTGSLEQSVNFDSSGKWLVTETEIKKTDLPQLVLSSIKNEFGGYKIKEAEKVETPGNGISYEVRLEKKEIVYSVEISPEGKIKKKLEESDEDKD